MRSRRLGEAKTVDLGQGPQMGREEKKLVAIPRLRFQEQVIF
jgi:hypothetical protein